MNNVLFIIAVLFLLGYFAVLGGKAWELTDRRIVDSITMEK